MSNRQNRTKSSARKDFNVAFLTDPRPTDPSSPPEARFYDGFMAYPKTSELGVEVRPQATINGFRVDFVLRMQRSGQPDLELIVEIDGHEWHSDAEQVANDQQRQKKLEDWGFRVLRLRAGDVNFYSTEVIPRQVIEALLSDKPIPPSGFGPKITPNQWKERAKVLKPALVVDGPKVITDLNERITKDVKTLELPNDLLDRYAVDRFIALLRRAWEDKNRPKPLTTKQLQHIAVLKEYFSADDIATKVGVSLAQVKAAMTG